MTIDFLCVLDYGIQRITQLANKTAKLGTVALFNHVRFKEDFALPDNFLKSKNYCNKTE